MPTPKLYLSNTSIQTFKSCKRKFKYKFIDRLYIGSSLANKHLSFGQSIHMALAQFNMITDKQYRTLQNLHTLLRKNWRRDGYETLEEEKEFGLKGISMLTGYFNKPLDNGIKTLLIEEMIKKDMNGKFMLCGKLDKVYIREDDVVETLDYKTGSAIDAIDFSQLSIYILLTHQKLGFYPGTISYYYLAHNLKIVQEVTDGVIDEVTQYLWGIYEEILCEKEYPCSPTPYCETNCEYYSICEDAKDENLMVINELKKLGALENLNTVF